MYAVSTISGVHLRYNAALHILVFLKSYGPIS